MEQKELSRKNTLKYVISVAAALLICFLVSNGISYAATGETWTEKIKLFINGQEAEKEIIWHQDEDGNCYGVLEVESAEDYNEVYVREQLEKDNEFSDSEADVVNYSSELVEEDGRQYLVIGESKIDITEDFADGKCQGTFEQSGKTYTYVITGTMEEYNISIEN